MPGNESPSSPGAARLDAADELEQVAEKLGAPIIKALLGKAAVPDDSPYTTGGIGLLGTKPSQEAMEDCDTLLMVGTSFPYIEFLPKAGQARGVQIDLDPMRIGLRYPGGGRPGRRQPRRTLQQLLPLLRRNNASRLSRRARRTGMREWWELMESAGTRDGQADEAAGRRLGTGQAAARRRHRLAAIRERSPPGGRATFRRSAGRCTRSPATSPPWRSGLPYAIAAQIAYPRPAVCGLRRRRRILHADGRVRDRA